MNEEQKARLLLMAIYSGNDGNLDDMSKEDIIDGFNDYCDDLEDEIRLLKKMLAYERRKDYLVFHPGEMK